MRLRLLAVLGILAAAASGCGGGDSAGSPELRTDSQPPVSTTRSGGQTFQPEGGDYQVTVPAGWKPLDRESVAEGFDSGANIDPALQKSLPGFARLIRQEGSMIAVDLTGDGRDSLKSTQFASNVLVIRSDVGYTESDEQAIEEAAGAIEQQVGANPIVTGTPKRTDGRQLGEADASTVEYDLEVNGTPTTETDWLTARGGVVYQFSCTAPKDRFPAFGQTCETIAASFRFTR